MAQDCSPPSSPPRISHKDYKELVGLLEWEDSGDENEIGCDENWVLDDQTGLLKKQSFGSQQDLIQQKDVDLSMLRMPGPEEELRLDEVTGKFKIVPKEIPKSRKRVLNPDNWVQNIRKKRREEGKEYVNINGKHMQQRAIKPGCNSKCIHNCNFMVNEDDRKEIFQKFWTLGDSKKGHYINKLVECTKPERRRKKGNNSRKSKSFKYFFDIFGNKIRVCKNFFLKTLDISQQRVYYFFKQIRCGRTAVPRSPLKGRNVKKSISSDKYGEVLAHINSFPSVESHYCRQNTSKKYLEQGLNLSKMYKLYCEQVEDPVKIHIYRKVFNTKCNLSFFKPKKDICDKCKEHDERTEITPEEEENYRRHLKKKENARAEKKRDKETINEPNKAIITFDLENIFTFPKSNVSNFYYRSKLTVYNLTAYCSLNKTAYNGIWHESSTGKTGNSIASALLVLINLILRDLPNIEHIILWSDSCVPQNRNSVMSTALIHFLQSKLAGKVKIIEQKFSEVGHSCCQEVDTAHSIIERHIRNMEIYSPLSFLKILLQLQQNSTKYKFKFVQLIPSDFMNYQIISQKFDFSGIPYFKTKHIIYKINGALPMSLIWRSDFDEEFKKNEPVRVRTPRSFKNNRRKDTHKNIKILDMKIINLPDPPMMDMKEKLPANKKKDLESMLKYMPKLDADYFRAILRN